MSIMPWSKLYTNKLRDLRLRRLSDQALADYFLLQMLAAELNSNGFFCENDRCLDDDDIAFKINMPPERVKSSMKEMRDAKLILVNGHGPYIADWVTEQPKWSELQEQRRKRDSKYRSKRRVDGASSTPLEREEEEEKESPLLLSAEKINLIRSKMPFSNNDIKKLDALLSQGADQIWIADALEIAQGKNKLRASYLLGIIQNWIIEGRGRNGKNGNSNNVPRTNKRTVKPQSHETHTPASDATREAAKRILAKRGGKGV